MGSRYSNSGKPQRLLTDGGDVFANGTGNRQALCLSAVLTNTTDATQAVVNIWILNEGDTATDAELLVRQQAVPANETVNVQELAGLVLEGGQRVYMDVSDADTVNATLSFTELF